MIVIIYLFILIRLQGDLLAFNEILNSYFFNISVCLQTVILKLMIINLYNSKNE